MRIHSLSAILAGGTRADTRNQDMLSLLESHHGVANLIDYAHSLVAQYCSWCAGRDISFADMQIRAADCGLCEFDNCIGRLADLGLWTFFELDITHGAIDKCFHC